MAFPATAARFHTNWDYGTGAALVPAALRLPPPVFHPPLARLYCLHLHSCHRLRGSVNRNAVHGGFAVAASRRWAVSFEGLQARLSFLAACSFHMVLQPALGEQSVVEKKHLYCPLTSLGLLSHPFWGRKMRIELIRLNRQELQLTAFQNTLCFPARPQKIF